jgi:hypothetical protein
MLSPNQRLQPQGQDVAAKVMDGEAIIINLANGVYYSTDRSGGLIWAMIERRHNLEEIVAELAARYEVSAGQAREDVDRLVRELFEENLISPCEDGSPMAGDPLPAPQERLPYERPTLNIYRDMGDLLALDPPTPGLGATPWTDLDEPSPDADEPEGGAVGSNGDPDSKRRR